MNATIAKRIGLLALVVLLVPCIAEAGKKKAHRGGDQAQESSCLEIDLQLQPVFDPADPQAVSYEAVLSVAWTCKRSDLEAYLAIEVNGQLQDEAFLDGVSSASLRVEIPLDQGAVEVCGIVEGLAHDKKTSTPISAKECRSFQLSQ